LHRPVFLVFGLLVAARLAVGQPCGPEWSPEFYGGDFDGEVRAFVTFDDGSGPALYAGGWFSQAGGDPDASGVARWNGQAWESIGAIDLSGTLDQVRALAVYDDGSGPALYVAGQFSRAGGIAAANIARWDGHSWSALDAGLVGTAEDLVVHDDGSGPALYVCGTLSKAGPIPVEDVARWDGQAWSDVGGGFPNKYRTYALAVYDDGSGPALYAGQYGSRLGRWDGHAWSEVGDPIEGRILTLAVATINGVTRLFAGGDFTKAGQTSMRHIGQWDGQAWSQVDFGVHMPVLALAAGDFGDGDGARLYIGTEFDPDPGLLDHSIFFWHGQDIHPAAATPFGPVHALAMHDDGSGPALYFGGGFSMVHMEGEHAFEAACVGRTGQGVWSAVGNARAGPGFNHGYGPDSLASVDIDGDGAPTLYAGGPIRSSGISMFDNCAQWDGAAWNSLGDGPDTVRCLGGFDDGSGPALYAATGSSFPAPIYRWNGAAWSDLAHGPPAYIERFVGWRPGGKPRLFTIDDGDGDAFSWDGNQWLAHNGAAVDGKVRAMTVFDDGAGPAVYVGGNFDFAGGVPVNSIARWNGQAWSALGEGTVAQVYALTGFDDGSGPALYAAGTFTSIGGISAAHIARWHNGAWSPLGAGVDGTAYALAVFDDGSGPKLYVAGLFTKAGGNPAPRIASWDGHEWSDLAGGLDGYETKTLVVHDPDGPGPIAPGLYVGGDFRRAGGISSGRIARWACPQPCPADLDDNGVLDFFDFLAFTNLFNDDDLKADFDDNGVLDLFDFLAFVNAFNEGC
jgi:hypothetical protein